MIPPDKTVLILVSVFDIKAALLVISGAGTMAKICQVTGKRPRTGYNVSHANNKTKRRFLPNLKKRRFWLPDEKRFVTLTVSTQGMRIIDKLGIDVVYRQICQAMKED